VSADVQQEAAMMQVEVMTASLAFHVAEQELAECGITGSPADVLAWMNASERQKRNWMLAYAVLAGTEPAWKSR
jgi:hypothetical protein